MQLALVYIYEIYDDMVLLLQKFPFHNGLGSNHTVLIRVPSIRELSEILYIPPHNTALWKVVEVVFLLLGVLRRGSLRLWKKLWKSPFENFKEYDDYVGDLMIEQKDPGEKFMGEKFFHLRIYR